MRGLIGNQCKSNKRAETDSFFFLPCINLAQEFCSFCNLPISYSLTPYNNELQLSILDTTNDCTSVLTSSIAKYLRI